MDPSVSFHLSLQCSISNWCSVNSVQKWQCLKPGMMMPRHGPNRGAYLKKCSFAPFWLILLSSLLQPLLLIGKNDDRHSRPWLILDLRSLNRSLKGLSFWMFIQNQILSQIHQGWFVEIYLKDARSKLFPSTGLASVSPLAHLPNVFTVTPAGEVKPPCMATYWTPSGVDDTPECQSSLY